MRKSLITIGLAAASLAAIAGLTACGTAAAATSGHPASAPATAGLPTADSLLARGYWRGVQEIALNPGMAKSGIVTAAYGVSYQATDGRGSGTQAEEVAVVYRTPAEARAGAAYFRGYAGARGLTAQPALDPAYPTSEGIYQTTGYAAVTVNGFTGGTGNSPSAANHAGPNAVIIFGARTDIAMLVDDSFGGNAGDVPAASTAPAAAPTAPAPVLATAGYDGIRPGFISFSADSGNVIENIRWSSWGPDSASGTGTSYLQGCVPNCAEGSMTLVPATVTLSAPAAGQFTWITEARNGQVSSGPVTQITGAQQYGPTPAAPAASPPPVTDPVAGTGTGPACTTVAGYFPGGLPGHEDSTGFCVPDHT
jgi:hypothetical protein